MAAKVGGLALLSLAASLVVIGAVVVTNPAQLGPGLMTAWFVVLFVALSGDMSLLIYYLRSRRSSDGQHPQLLSAVRQASLVSGFIVIMLALSSLRQLSGRDVVILAVMAVLGEIFLRSKM